MKLVTFPFSPSPSGVLVQGKIWVWLLRLITFSLGLLATLYLARSVHILSPRIFEVVRMDTSGWIHLDVWQVTSIRPIGIPFPATTQLIWLAY